MRNYISLLIVTLAFGCSNNLKNTKALKDEWQSKTNYHKTFVYDSASKYKIAILTNDFCLNNSTAPTWRVLFNTDFSEHVFNLTLDESQTYVQVSDSETKFKYTFDKKLRFFKQDYCKKFTANSDISNDPIEKYIGNINQGMLEDLMPECRIKLNDKGYYCKMRKRKNDTNYQSAFLGIRNRIVRKWARKPYLFVRRLAIGLQISKILQKDSKKLDKICDIVTYSSKEELPFILQHTESKASLCDSSTAIDKRLSFARYILMKTNIELGALEKVYNKINRLGSINLQIPNLKSNTVFKVSIEPKDGLNTQLIYNIMDQLDKTAHKYMVLNKTKDYIKSNICWHPVINLNKASHVIMSILNVRTKTTQISCVPNKITKKDTEYVLDSLSSDLDFFISNRYRKLLSLPYGEYTYKVTEKVRRPSYNEQPKLSYLQAPDGSIKWQRKRPRIVISKVF